jgi:UDP-N-acetyl-D-mannosaminuronic acid dehydrogenase
MENTYRDVNIALANEMLRMGAEFGIDIWEAISIANLHPRVNIMQPGPGVGGHCISVDPWFLVEAAPKVTPLIRTSREVNDSQPEYVVRRVEKILGTLAGRKIAVLGLTYKPDVDDVRESPSLEIVRLLSARGAEVTTCDPLAPDVDSPGRRARSVEEAAAGADALILLVGHQPYRGLSPEKLRPLMKQSFCLDCQHAWDRARWEAAGFQFHQLGDGRQPPPSATTP